MSPASPSRPSLPVLQAPSDLVRKWYRTEAALVSADGYVKNHEKGEVIPPQNGVCAKVLANREGFRRCNLSVKTLVGKITEANGDARVVHSCHLGLGMVGVRADGHQDATFCCGVALRTIDTKELRPMADKLATIGLDPNKVSGFDKIPVLDAREIERLADLLMVTANELESKPFARAPGVESQEPKEEEGSLREQVQAFERKLIHKGLIRTHWNRVRLAQLLGISRTTLLAKMEAYDLAEPTPKNESR